MKIVGHPKSTRDWEGASMALSRKSSNASVEIAESPRRYKKIYRNFDLLLPKFHFILPNFYFPVPWRIFFSSLATSKFLRGDRLEDKMSRALFMALC